MMRLTLDSSVFVAALREREEKHEICKKILEGVFNGTFEVFEPFSVLVEVVAAIKRRTKSTELAKKIKTALLSVETIVFEELVAFRAQEASDLAISTGIRGMDVLVVQTAKENKSVLVSLDNEMLHLIKGIVSVKLPDNLF
ncbi:type II toxin-antitoxin system VapC family toxin [Candidatus Saganbacteria bacterium]|nr:type II toxin-antitoxin system VapC family toxin [Candidatus Saganbacteria bacterium]